MHTSDISQELSLLHRVGNGTAFLSQAIGNKTGISLENYIEMLHGLQALFILLKAVQY